MTTPAETAETATALLESGAIMLGAALVFVTVFRKLKLGATLGYIVGGAVIGPYVLGLIGDPQALLSVTEIGIALLLFIVGLELHPSRGHPSSLKMAAASVPVSAASTHAAIASRKIRDFGAMSRAPGVKGWRLRQAEPRCERRPEENQSGRR